jgi:hypothetical protein
MLDPASLEFLPQLAAGCDRQELGTASSFRASHLEQRGVSSGEQRMWGDEIASSSSGGSLICDSQTRSGLARSAAGMMLLSAASCRCRRVRMFERRRHGTTTRT